MSNILNKSNHPVEVKKISVRIWKLRDEIEAAIAKRMDENGHTDDSPADIEDIKEYYLKILNQTDDNANETDEAEEDSNLDSSGNPLDDDAMAMMAAIGGGDEGDKKEESSTEDGSEETSNEEDDEAAKLAAEMLGDQAPSSEDDEAAKLAAEMLGDQAPSPAEDDDAAKLAAEMLGDQAPAQDDEAAKLAADMLADQQGSPSTGTTEEKKALTPFKRMTPADDKIAYGFVLLSDVQMDQLMIFAKHTYIHGQSIVIEFLVPKAFSQMVEIKSCLNISRNSKIISATKPDFRLQCQFLFKFPGERSTLRNFLLSVEPTIPDPPTKLKRPDSDEDDDDFDDLGF
ncbi:MAG: hypothetical protein HON90_03640 [Halobacteriovoraceae bacterium]|jgi:hypothetical protein|nr:hypothetical protein [Halobacteriovoraceae bacterium]